MRLKSVKLPEAEGPRSGVIGSGPEIRVLILGDSAAAGVGASTQQEALTGHLLEHLKPYFQVHWKLEAKTGDSTQDVITRLIQLDAEPFDWVITSMGVNDVTGQIQPSAWREQQQCVIDLLKDKFSAKQLLITSVPPMHKFPALPQPLRWILGRQACQLNLQLERLMRTNSNCKLVEPDLTLDPLLMAEDGFHPGPELYKQWAHHVARIILE